MLHKSFQIVEAKADAETGVFEALVSVFGNVDRGGDRVMPGAFQKSLERWRESGDPIPVILSHQWDNPMAHIGVADPNEVMETAKGLLVKGQLDIADNDVARQVHKLMKRRSLREFSFGYDVPKGGSKRAKDATELHELDLVEVGPTLKGMNPATELHAVKSALTAAVAGDIGGRIGLGFQEKSLEQQVKELQERLDRLEKSQEPSRKAEEADKETEMKSRSVDPLRRQSDELALNVARGSVPASHPKARDTRRPDDELRRRSRDLMLTLLSQEKPK